jgi:hypothetical protein
MSETAFTDPDIEVAETADDEVPVLFLHQVERNYRQGDETLHIPKVQSWPSGPGNRSRW